MKGWNLLFKFFIDIYKAKELLYKLILNDIKQQYLGSYLGILWAFIQPIVSIIVMWFVFQVGFKATPIDGVPFILWLSAGMIPWFFLSDAIGKGTNVIVENSFLVKKIVFRVSLLPLVKVMSAFFIHLFFIFFLALMFCIYGFYPTIYLIQLPFFILCAIILNISITYITSSINVFFKDMGQIVALILQILFWLTPIFWTTKLVPEKYLWFIEYNPFYYIIKGYRESFIYHRWFWEDLELFMHFAVTVFILLIIGIFVFKRLKPHFADVL